MFYSLIGISMLLFASFVCCLYSNSYYDKKSELYRELLSFLYTAKQKMLASSAMLSSILSDTDDLSVLRSIGFFELAQSNGMRYAFETLKEKMNIEPDDKKALTELFSHFGSNTLYAEVENITRCIDDIENSYNNIKNKIPDMKKVSNTVIICVTLLAIILIV